MKIAAAGLIVTITTSLVGCMGRRDAAPADARPVSLAQFGECAASSQAAQASCRAEVRPYPSMEACVRSEVEVFNPLCHALNGGPVSTTGPFKDWCEAMTNESAIWYQGCIHLMSGLAARNCEQGYTLAPPRLEPDAVLTPAEMQARRAECERVHAEGDPEAVAEAATTKDADYFRGYEFECMRERRYAEGLRVAEVVERHAHADAGPASP